MERSGTSISNAVTILEGNGDKEKQLASLLKACKENPCSGNVIALQDSLMKDWGKKISKSGKSDGDFGPMTMGAINDITGNNVQKPGNESAGKPNAGKKVDTNQVGSPKIMSDPISGNDTNEVGKSPEKTAQAATESNGKDTESAEKINVAGEKVVSSGERLKNEIATIKEQTSLFNISSQIDKATPIVKKYLEENVRDLNLLVDNKSSLNPETKAKILSQLKELSDGLHKGVSSRMVSENSRSQMAKWAPEVDKIRNKLG